MKHISLRCHTYLSLILFSIREMHFRNKTQRDRDSVWSNGSARLFFVFFTEKYRNISIVQFQMCGVYTHSL